MGAWGGIGIFTPGSPTSPIICRSALCAGSVTLFSMEPGALIELCRTRKPYLLLSRSTMLSSGDRPGTCWSLIHQAVLILLGMVDRDLLLQHVVVACFTSRTLRFAGA